MPFQVKDVAELSGVSIRTLRYYDAIGLLQPTQKSPAGYRPGPLNARSQNWKGAR